MQLFILIETEKCSCSGWRRGREDIHRSVNVALIQFEHNRVKCHCRPVTSLTYAHHTHIYAHTNHAGSHLLPLIERSHIAEVFAN